MTTIAQPLSVRPKQLPGRRYDRYFFAGMVVALLITAFAGFTRTYYLAGLSSAKLPAPIIHVHAVLQTAWILLLLVQMLLVSAKRVPLIGNLVSLDSCWPRRWYWSRSWW